MAVDAEEDLKIISDQLNRAMFDLLETQPVTIETLRSALVKTIAAAGYAADAVRKTRRKIAADATA